MFVFLFRLAIAFGAIPFRWVYLLAAEDMDIDFESARMTSKRDSPSAEEAPRATD